VVETALPYLGDLCVIDVLDDDGQVRRVAARHVDPAREATVREFAAHDAPKRGSYQAVARVIESGEPLLVADVTNEEVQRLVAEPRDAALVRQLGVRSLLVVPLVAGARTIGALALSSTTPRRYGARELRVAKELALRAAAAIGNADEHRRAQRAVRSRENVLAIVSHDLRSPLNTIHMAAAMIAKDAADPRQRKHSETIARASFRMQHLISDLLDVASIEAGRLRVEPRPHDAREIVREALETHEPLAAERGLAVSTKADLEGVRVLCDRERVLQVLANLVGNALKFCGSRCSVEIGARVDGGFLELAVADTGPGIPAAELPHLFDAWWSAERHAMKGSGLGLFISRGIVEAHGGKLWVQSDPGGGATFFFTLPLAPPEK
jgi:signal transduction histidine kinase